MTDYTYLKIGDVVDVNGQRMRYVGSGRLEPVECVKHEVLAKRFDGADSGPLLTRSED